MSSATAHMLTGRDVALLRAVADGRCALSVRCEPVLLIDGLPCADFAAARRLIEAGLLAVPGAGASPGPARLTAAGRAALAPVGDPAG